jgi:hypothetical protein
MQTTRSELRPEFTSIDDVINFYSKIHQSEQTANDTSGEDNLENSQQT